jgi:hypothetical protein
MPTIKSQNPSGSHVEPTAKGGNKTSDCPVIRERVERGSKPPGVPHPRNNLAYIFQLKAKVIPLQSLSGPPLTSSVNARSQSTPTNIVDVLVLKHMFRRALLGDLEHRAAYAFSRCDVLRKEQLPYGYSGPIIA